MGWSFFAQNHAQPSCVTIVLRVLGVLLAFSRLAAMKEVKALDISGDGRITEKEFKRMYNPLVMVAAGVKVKADEMWSKARTDKNGTRCGTRHVTPSTDHPLGPPRCTHVSSPKHPPLHSILSPPKHPPLHSRLLSALNRLRVLHWPRFSWFHVVPCLCSFSLHSLIFAPSRLPGTLDRIACWDMIFGDDDLAHIMGKGTTSDGKA